MMVAPTATDARTFDPVIAFGLKAVALAMKAKTHQLRRGEPAALLNDLFLTVPEDVMARDAVLDFAALAITDQPAAGQHLHEFIIEWRGGALSQALVATEAALRSQAAHQWQDRRDCGVD